MRPIHLIHAFVLFTASVLPALAQGTAFTYQGRLNDNAAPASGTYDLQFTVYDSVGGATVVAGPLTGPGVPVTDGLFTVTLDFGTSVFTGPARWLQIGVRTNGGVTFVNLNPRQALTPAPYAIFAATASNVVNGAVVKSVNGLKDDVTLTAGANVTLTPSGNTITIASTAGSAGETNSLWSLNGASAYYNAGNVGIGTATPAYRLDVGGRMRVRGAGGSGAGIWFTESGTPTSDVSFFGRGADDQNWTGLYSVDWRFVVTDSGNVGIGTVNPTSKLHVQGDEFLSGNAYFGSQTRQILNLYSVDFGIGIQNNVLYQRSAGSFYWFQGGTHQDATGNAGGGLALLSLDQLGIHFGARLGQFVRLYEDGVNFYGSGVQAGTHYFRTGGQPGDAFAWHKGGIHNDSPRNAGGGQTLMTLDGENGLAISGNASQARDKGGWVKAMAKVNADGTVARQYSALGGAISAVYSSGYYYVTFPFPVDDRFISVTPQFNGSVGIVAATASPDPLSNRRVQVFAGPLIDPSATDPQSVANEFFIFVY